MNWQNSRRNISIKLAVEPFGRTDHDPEIANRDTGNLERPIGGGEPEARRLLAATVDSRICTIFRAFTIPASKAGKALAKVMAPAKTRNASFDGANSAEDPASHRKSLEGFCGLSGMCERRLA
jgi:hypothetical protein